MLLIVIFLAFPAQYLGRVVSFYLHLPTQASLHTAFPNARKIYQHTAPTSTRTGLGTVIAAVGGIYYDIADFWMQVIANTFRIHLNKVAHKSFLLQLFQVPVTRRDLVAYPFSWPPPDFSSNFGVSAVNELNAIAQSLNAVDLKVRHNLEL
jgi:hypothetical protein